MAGGFHSLGLLPELLKAIDEQGWLLPTDVQDEAIPLILGGGDVMVASETGSGKTGSFILPVLQCVSERLRALADDCSAAPSSSSSTVTTKDSIIHYDVKINENDRDTLLTIDNDGYTAYSTADKVWVGGRCTHGVKHGKYFYEATLITPPNMNTSNAGVCRFGWSTMSAHYELGKDSYGFGYGGTAMKSYNNTFAAYGIKYSGAGVVIGCFLDRESNSISYSVNGVDQGKAFDIPENLSSTVLFPAFVFKGAGAVFNFGKQPFQYLVSSSSSSLSAYSDYNAMYQPISSSHIVSCNSTEAFRTGSSSSSGSTGGNKNTIRHPLAVIIEPSRELAEQVYQNIKELSCHLTNPSIQSVLLVGGGAGNGTNTLAEHDPKKIMQILKTQGCDIVVGTLGKIVELVKSKIIEFSQIRFFILDEADRLTDGENLSNIMSLYTACPVGGTGENRLQVCFFSATLHSPAITNLASKICVNPTWVDLKGMDSVPDTVHHVICNINIPHHIRYLLHPKVESITDNAHSNELIQFISHTLKSSVKVPVSTAVSSLSLSDADTTAQEILKKLFQNGSNSNNNSNNKKFDTDEIASQLIKLLKQQLLLQIIDKFNMSQCMIFCRTNLDCDNLETFLCTVGQGKKYNAGSAKQESGREHLYSCCVLGGMRSMEERRRSLEAFKSGNVRFLLCTDIAARGIDVQGLPFVVNMTLPDEAENYIHRIGRVGRADKMGLAISVVAPSSSNRNISNTIEERFNDNSNGGSSCICCSDSSYCRVVSMNVDTTDTSTAATSTTSTSTNASIGADIGKLLSDCKEKVWYHTCSSRGKNCHNRTLKSSGGCTVWYDEAEILSAIKKRLHIEEDEYIPELSEIDFSLPSSLADLGVVYGEDSGDALRKQQEDKQSSSGGASSVSQMNARLNQLQSTVKELSQMEFEAQNMFLNYQTRFI